MGNIPFHGIVTGDIDNDGFRDIFLYSKTL